MANGSPALTLGFRNFPMDVFGVVSPSLKQLALQPEIPALITDSSFGDKSAPFRFMGGTLKSVNGLGDCSAYGLPDEKGVIILSAPGSSLLAKSGLQKKDVIRSADGKPVSGLKELIDICQAGNWKGHIPVKIIRNQQEMDIELIMK